jgi:hypothetical protein
VADLKTNMTNAWESTLSSGLAAGATTINVTDTTGSPAVSFYVVIEPGSDTKREVVLVDSSKTSTTFVLSAATSRGQDGTSDVQHDSGAPIAIVPIAAWFTDLHDRADAKATDANVVHLAGAETITGAKTFSVDPTLADGSSALSLTEGNAAYVAAGGGASADVSTAESTTSNTFADLATVGPAATVDVPASGKVRVVVIAEIKSSANDISNLMSFAMSGANAAAAADANAANGRSTVYSDGMRETILTGLAPGSTSFTAKYRTGGSTTTGTFTRRRITVTPL